MKDLQIWAHRGYHVTGAKENSLEAIDESVKYGYDAIEFDVHLIHNLGIFVKHDPILDGEEKSLPTFSGFLARQGNNIKYWIDFKNLFVSNVDEACIHLKAGIEQNNIDYKRCYVASEDLNSLIMLRKLMPDIHLIAHLTEENGVELGIDFVLQNNLKNIAIDFNLLSKEFIENCKNINIFAYTIDSISDLKKIYNDFGIRIITSNTILYKDL